MAAKSTWGILGHFSTFVTLVTLLPDQLNPPIAPATSLVLHLTRLNKVFNYKEKEFRWGENRESECVAPTYLGNWERIYAESLVYIMAILSDTDLLYSEHYIT